MTTNESNHVFFACVSFIAIMGAAMILERCAPVDATIDKPTLLIVGDSIAAGLHENNIGKDAIAELREHYTVYAQGVHGSTSHGVLLQIAGGIGRDVDRVWLIVGYLDRHVGNLTDAETAQSVARVKRTFDPSVDFTWTDTLELVAEYPEHLKTDGIHLNADGYDRLVDEYLAKGHE